MNSTNTLATVGAPAGLSHPEVRAGLLSSLRRLHDKGLCGPAEMSLSLRIPGTEDMALLVTAPGDGQAQAEDIRILSRATQYDDEQADIHATIYRMRPDVGAVVRNRPRWGSVLHDVKQPMPAIFDEQARQMGASVERLDGRLQRLRRGANVFLYGGDVLCLGMTRDRSVFTCELLEKCAEAYVLATATGRRLRRIPWFVRLIAGRRLLKDERKSAAAYARGEVPTGFTAY